MFVTRVSVDHPVAAPSVMENFIDMLGRNT